MGGMGFRDLAKFNIALLAKQGWHILTNPTCLLARVLKARYYPIGNFLNARLGSYPSYTWRSIYSARGLLEHGLGWRVGDGQSIDIWSEAWITGTSSGRVESSVTNGQFFRVVDLIETSTHTWNEDLIRSIFSNQEALNILRIPLPHRSIPDFRIWRGDRSGLYSVRSGYRWLISSELDVSWDLNDVQDEWLSRFFKSLWSLDLTPKIRISVWRLIQNYCPTFSNLHIRRINTNLHRLLCGSAPETNVHLLRDCSFVNGVCAGLGINLTAPSANQDWLKCFTSSVSAPLAEVRNDRWSPPGHSVFKVNFDASFNSLQHSSVSGIIIRDENGMTMAASSYPHRFVADPESAEALSCLQALVFAQELGFRRIVVEGDSFLVISKLSNSRMDFSSVSSILFSIKDRARDFDLISFVHINRARNQVAHSLASLGKNFSSPQVWIEEAPLSVDSFVQRDRWWINPPA
ncbi:hypothetical protein GQ457_13G010390 [Hibiscus cannabinus]